LKFDHGLKPGQAITNNELQSKFKCAPRGGMRRSLTNNTLVIISDPFRAIYEDRWIGDVFHYTGMGMSGDQIISFQQNKTLAESATNGVDVHLFEVFEEGLYTFIGKVKLADDPYQEDQPDVQGRIRKVWVFPLKVVEQDEIVKIPESIILKKQEKKEREAKKLSDDELKKRAKYFNKGVGVRQVITISYERNPYVTELAKRRAKGICHLCEKPAPFKGKRGDPFLETHHIEWLSNRGEDIIENTVALCPNCHRKMHSLNINVDIEKLKTKAGTEEHKIAESY